MITDPKNTDVGYRISPKEQNEIQKKVFELIEKDIFFTGRTKNFGRAIVFIDGGVFFGMC